ncbi:hypothetical protein L484_018067 [Morus notabilis]|uniref:Uncharacterized protein n=1 Tax=Morus notabilis TaxID=981085 RepID=W9QVG6_9ROSA|nr:uncharacterized protein LOC21401046 [Morus notabilis]EXB55141.1 hypothetical protein L484_018067 [Morus notabilis]
MSTVEFTSTTRIASLVLKPSIDMSFTEEQLRSQTTKLVHISYQYVVLENKFLSKTWKDRLRTEKAPERESGKAKKMSSGGPKIGSGGGGGGGGSGGGGGFRARIDHYLYSGEKKHVAAGIAIITIVFGIPWVLMNRGSKHQSHQDYLEKADKARSQRLSSGSSSAK